MTFNIQGAYIADGFADDCDELLHRCRQAGTLNYEKFCDIWKEMRMASVFYGRTSGAELAELSEELIHIAKHYMVANTSDFEESVAGLFLVYGLLNLQPYPNFASLRLLHEDIPALERIELVARRDRRQDVLYILGSVLIKGPVQYQAAERERGMEYPIRKYLEGDTNIGKLGRPKGVFYRQNKELDLLKEIKDLSVRYTTAKENIPGVSHDDRNLNFFDPNLAADLEKSLKDLVSGKINEASDGNESSASCDHIKNLKKKAMMAPVQPIRHRIGVDNNYMFEPFGVETLGPWGPSAHRVFRHISKLLVDSSRDQRAGLFFGQRISIAIQRGNAASVLGTFSIDSDVDEFFDAQSRNPCRPEASSSKTNQNRPLKRSRTLSSEAESDVRTIDDLQSDDDFNMTNFGKPEGDDEMSVDQEFEDQEAIRGGSEIDDLSQPSTSWITLPSTSGATDMRRRDSKKTILKSRFKRMGMLPVANFESK